jgi:alpha-L-arabinofuranosidase
VFSETNCPGVDVPALVNLPARRSVPLLDVSASRDDGRLTVFVINRDPQTAQAAELELSGFDTAGPVQVHAVSGDGYQAQNAESGPEAVSERLSSVDLSSPYAFPPCSVTALVLERPAG